MSAALFEVLERAGVPTHYLGTQSDREMLCRRLDIIKIERSAEHRRRQVSRSEPGLEKAHTQAAIVSSTTNRPSRRPMLTTTRPHAAAGNPAEAVRMRRMTLRINAILRPHLARVPLAGGFQAEFGRRGRSSIWAMRSLRHVPPLDSGARSARQRPVPRDMGGVEESYQEV